MTHRPDRPMRTYTKTPLIKPPLPTADSQRVQYDYTNQAWIVDGRYQRCGHPSKMHCRCYGKLHAGEPAAEGAEIH